MRIQFGGSMEGTASSFEKNCTAEERQRLAEIDEATRTIRETRHAQPPMPPLSLRERFFGKSQQRLEREEANAALENRAAALGAERYGIFARQFDR